jgi:threonine dehydratase
MYVPTFHDVLHARVVIAPHLRPTPLFHYKGLSDLVGAEVWVKHENHPPVGAFKVRGGINLMAHLSDQERRKGVVTASTGNHGQSIAYGARLFDVRAIIAVPDGANPGKVAAIRNLGAEIHFHGQDFDDARLYAEALANRDGMRFVSSGDEPYLIAGVGTYALEILEALPAAEVIIVPVGGGSGAAGTCLVAKTVNPDIQVIGVQAEKAPSAYLTWLQRERVEAKMDTFAEGLATRAPFDLPQAILQRHLDHFELVSETALKEAVILMLEHTHNLAEGAGAAALAAALELKDRLNSKRVVLVQSGGNLSLAKLREIIG